MIDLTIYLDGKTSECGYKYTVTKNFSGWTACRNDNEFRYFIQNTGLKINPECTEIRDYSDSGKGRIITTAFYEREKSIVITITILLINTLQLAAILQAL